MDAHIFIEVIRRYVHQSAVQGVLENMKTPPGRFPSTHDVRVADWCKNLRDEDHAIVETVIDTAVTHALFGFFCVLDGVRVVEDTAEKGKFELYYVSESERTLLNDPAKETLHDIYNR